MTTLFSTLCDTASGKERKSQHENLVTKRNMFGAYTLRCRRGDRYTILIDRLGTEDWISADEGDAEASIIGYEKDKSWSP